VKTAGGVIKTYQFTSAFALGEVIEIAPGYDKVAVPVGALYSFPAGTLVTEIIATGSYDPGAPPILIGTGFNGGTNTVTGQIAMIDLSFGRATTLLYYCEAPTTLYISGFTAVQTFKICYK